MVKSPLGQLLREHTQNCFLVCSFRASASETCSYATSPAESRSREIVPQARMECSQQAETPSRRKTSTAMEAVGACKQRLNDVQSRVGATATRAHVESPLCTELIVDSCSVRHQGNCCASTNETPAPLGSLSAQQAQRDVHATRLLRSRHLRSHATSTLGSFSVRRETCSDKTAPCAKRHVPSKILLRSRAAPRDR